jgi:hypothetical protein
VTKKVDQFPSLLRWWSDVREEDIHKNLGIILSSPLLH